MVLVENDNIYFYFQVKKRRFSNKKGVAIRIRRSLGRIDEYWKMFGFMIFFALSTFQSHIRHKF